MTPERENELTLAQILGISEEEASERLSKRVAITGSERAPRLASELREQVGRTLTLVDDGTADVEVVLDGTATSTAPIRIFVRMSGDRVEVSTEGPAATEEAHPLLICVAGCYIASVVIDRATELNRGPERLVVRFDDLGVTSEQLKRDVDLANPVLAGAGAIGNGFLRALRHLNVSGSVTIADPKNVAPGNPNRCLYFDESSVSKPKAEELCTRAQADFPHLELLPFNGTFSELRKREGKVRRVIVATDSRRVRRTIQSELPLEVVDASTTGTEEIIVHSHRQPTTGACLGCIYKHVPDELSRQREIAASLGIAVADVQRDLIDDEVAEKIIKKHLGVRVEDISGKAFDSLFRELCATEALTLPTGEQVFAPFTFVSSLAGALLATELLRFCAQPGDGGTNYFFANPWRPPNAMARRRRPRIADCEFCSRPEFAEALKSVWDNEVAV